MWLTRRTSLAIRHRIMRDFFFLFRALRDARRIRPRNNAAPGRVYTRTHTYNDSHAKFDAMQVSSSRKSSGASCDIRDYEGARTTRRGARREERLKGERGRKGLKWTRMEGTSLQGAARETRCRFNITVFPLSLYLSCARLLAITCNLIVGDLTFDANKQSLLFVGRTRALIKDNITTSTLNAIPLKIGKTCKSFDVIR